MRAIGNANLEFCIILNVWMLEKRHSDSRCWELMHEKRNNYPPHLHIFLLCNLKSAGNQRLLSISSIWTLSTSNFVVKLESEWGVCNFHCCDKHKEPIFCAHIRPQPQGRGREVHRWSECSRPAHRVEQKYKLKSEIDPRSKYEPRQTPFAAPWHWCQHKLVEARMQSVYVKHVDGSVKSSSGGNSTMAIVVMRMGQRNAQRHIFWIFSLIVESLL